MNNYKPLSFGNTLMLYIEENANSNKKNTLPILDEVFPLLYLAFTIFIVPIFYINLYVFGLVTPMDNSYLALLLIFISSCSSLYILFMISWNIHYKNTGNVFNLIKKIILFYRSWNVRGTYLILLSLTPIIILILINMGGISILFYFLGIKKGNILVYMYTRICILPIIVYINYIVINNVLLYFGIKKTNINYSIFSENMCECFTISRIILLIIFMSMYNVGSTAVEDTSISGKTRLPKEVPTYSASPKIFFTPADYAEVGNKTKRLVNIYSALPVDIPTEVKAVLWSQICPNNSATVKGQIPQVGLDVPNVRGPLFMTYGVRVYIDPSVFIQNDVVINDTPVTVIRIGKNTAIAAGVNIVGVGHPLDVETRSKPISMAKSFGRDILIGDGVVIGTNSIILGGTVLGDFAIVQANSVVNGKVIPANYTTDGKNMWPSSKYNISGGKAIP